MIGNVQYGWCAAKRALACFALILAVGSARATTRYWTGASNALASNAANWLTDPDDSTTTGAPVAGDDVVFGAAGEGKACTWDLNVALGSWTQSDYTSIVTIQTVYGTSGFTCLTINGAVNLQSGTWTHVANDLVEQYRLCVSCGGNFTVGADAKVIASGKGYIYECGPGADGYEYHGSSHGGRGAISSGPTPGGDCYGSLTEPTSLGSGANCSGWHGGGAIRIVVAGNLQVDGWIAANGSETSDNAFGSGGSVWVTAATLSGAGYVTADAHAYQGAATSGRGAYPAGGRVAVWLTGASAGFTGFTGQIRAYGAYSVSYQGHVAGGAGTVYLKTGDQGASEGTLIIDNSYVSGWTSQPTEISELVTDCAVGKLVVEKGATLKLMDGKILSVCGSIENRGTITAEGISGLRLTGTGASTVDGSFSVGTFECLTPDKTISFTSATTLSILSGGCLKLAGAAEHPVTICGTEVGTETTPVRWGLCVDAAADALVSQAQIVDCDASTGRALTAVNSSLVRSLNWTTEAVASGATITWTGGAGDSRWSADANWNLGRPPVTTDRIVIPATSVDPALSTSFASLDLTVASGATLDLNGFDYSVSDSLTMAGTLKSAGSPLVTVGGNCTFTGGALRGYDITLTIAGSGSTEQSLAGGGLSFGTVTLAPGANGLHVTEGLSAAFLTMSAEAARTIRVDPGVTLAATLGLTCSASGSQLSLVSSTAGSQWNLAANGRQSVSGVTVQDCVASASPICATDSTDGGNNVNWNFGASTLFHWTDPASPPSATDDAYVDSALTVAAGAVTVRSLMLKNGAAFVLPNESPLTVTGDLIAEGTSTATLNGTVSVGGSLIVGSGATLTHAANAKVELYKMDLSVGGDLWIEEGGSIDVSAKGYSKAGPGYDTANYVGAAHGGRSYFKPTTMGAGVCYGSLIHPYALGSGLAQFASNGGGAAKLTVAKTLRNDGSVLAYGYHGESPNNTSGGSIWITAGRIVGTTSSAVISASAAPHRPSFRYNLSGGGRVAVHLTDPAADFTDFVGSITAYGKWGKYDSQFFGGAGTVYLRKGSEAENGGTLIVDNGIVIANTYGGLTEISSTVLDKEVGSVIVRNGAVLKICADESLSVSGDITNTAKIVTEANSGLVITGTGTSFINCDLTLSSFVCQAPDKEIVFADGSTLMVTNGGRFQVEGEEDHTVTLRSQTNGTFWNLNVDSTAMQSVSYATVVDSDASSGAQIDAINSTLTNTKNWTNTEVIYGQTIRWTGATGESTWLAAGNWNRERPPIEGDHIIIPAMEVSPVLSTSFTSLDLAVEEGATFDLNGFDYTVENSLSVTGTLKSAGSPLLTVGGNCLFAGGALRGNNISLKVKGTGSSEQILDGGGLAFGSVTLTPGANGLHVTNGLSAAFLTMSAEAARTIRVDPGVTLASTLGLTCSASGSQLSLVSSTAGSQWNLAANGRQSVSGVTVQDCVASASQICATDSTDGGNNVNWNFGTSTLFHWTDPASPPSATDDAYVDSALTVAAGAVTARSLTLKNGAAFVLPNESPLTVTGDLIAEGTSTATLNGKVTVGGSLIVGSGATLTHSPNAKEELYKLDLTVGGDLYVEEGGSIDVSAKGYSQAGPGYDKNSHVGAAHGGRSYFQSASSMGDGPCYGSLIHPFDLGSGIAEYACNGGGAVKLTIAGTLRLEGSILSYGYYKDNSGDRPYNTSGGSIWITAGGLVGTTSSALVSASAAPRSIIMRYNLSGGGRVAVHLTDPTSDFSCFIGSITAYGVFGRYVGEFYAGAGTVYLRKGDEAENEGTLIVDNGTSTSNCGDTEISSTVLDKEVGSVIVRNGGSLKILSGERLTASGDITNDASVEAEDDGGIVLVGIGTSHIDGDLTLPIFKSVTPGKEIVFGDGTTLTIPAGGSFQVEGSSDENATLRSQTAGTAWNLSVDSSASVSVQLVKVLDSDASSGCKITAYGSQLTRTVNWTNVTTVAGATNTWTGAANSSLWLEGGNWSLGRPPVKTDRVVVAAAASQPVLSLAFESVDLTVAAGATLDLNGFDATVTNKLTLAGALKSSGATLVTVGGDCDLTGGALDGGLISLTVAGQGGAEQTLAGGGLSFHAVILKPGANGLNVTDGLSARELTMSAEAARTIRVDPGVTLAATLDLTCAAPSSALSLISSVTGSRWNLAANGRQSVSGVMVRDCAATASRIRATDSTNGGNNVNWIFGSAGLFHWTDPASPPSATDDAYVDSALTVAAGSVTMRSLTLKTGATFNLPTTATLEVTGDAFVESGVTATLDGAVSVGGTMIVGSGATLTHSANAKAELYKIDLSVGGDLMIEEGGSIDVSAKGYNTAGPGYVTVKYVGAAHGGCSYQHSTVKGGGACYGSLIHPYALGSGISSFACNGGGSVKLTVGKALVVEGSIVAYGYQDGDYTQNTSGGSIWITAGQLVGSKSAAVISASASMRDRGFRYNLSGGGRVAVHLTESTADFGDYAGAITAYGTYEIDDNHYYGGAGTVYLRAGGEKENKGTLVLDNGILNAGVGGVTEFPATNDDPLLKNEGRAMHWLIRNGAALSLTDNAKIGSIEFDTAVPTRPMLYLNGYKLKVNDYRPRAWPKDGSLPTYVVAGEDAQGNPGTIVWKQGTAIILR